MTQQGARQASARAQSGFATATNYNEDLMRLFDADGIPAGTFNERQLRWINYRLAGSHTNVNNAMQAFATASGAYNWSSLGSLSYLWLNAFMASQSDGFWYDFGSTDRLFQESVGPTPATAPGNPIGLALSQRTTGGQSLAQVLAAATEGVSNPGSPFTATTGWTQQQGVMSVVSGKLRAARSAGSNGRVTAPITCVVGWAYSVDLAGIAATATASVVIANSTASTAGAPLSMTLSGRYFFVATQTTHYVMLLASAGADGTYVEISGVSVKEVSRYPATQVTAGSRPAFQSTGAVFDGTADNLLTGYVAGAAANFIVAKVTVPASVGATQVISGARQSSSLLMYLGVTATGALRANVGGTDQDIAVDLRGQTAVVGLSNQGGVLRSFVLGSAMAEGAHAGGVSTTLVLPIGSYFSGGGTTAFFGGSIHKVVAGREFIDLARFNQIASQL